jgi:hypothetical protein
MVTGKKLEVPNTDLQVRVRENLAKEGLIEEGDQLILV